MCRRQQVPQVCQVPLIRVKQNTVCDVRIAQAQSSVNWNNTNNNVADVKALHEYVILTRIYWTVNIMASSLLWRCLLFTWFPALRLLLHIKQNVHAEKSVQNLIKSTRNQIVFIMHRLISKQTDVCLVPNQPENGECNLISVWFNKIPKRYLFVCIHKTVLLWDILPWLMYIENRWIHTSTLNSVTS